MKLPRTTALAGLVSLAAKAAADPTWPASTDYMEEVLYQLSGFRASLFSDNISPCSNEASGPGRQNAAEWLRAAFHDMSTANNYFGTGGLDASLQFELTNSENTGPGHNTTLKFLSNYLTKQSTMADLLAAGVYASVRSCGGPIVPLRLGRIDATSAGSIGVPQPQNSIGIFTNQFDRMGFNVTEMIEVVACGHTLGGVHTTEFPDLVPPGTAPNGEGALDSTVAKFDSAVALEYLDGTTQNPLVIGPSIALGKNADFRVFNADGNVTVSAMSASADAWASTCQRVLQKMIEVVPAGVTLSDAPLAPYFVKPVALQLTLNQDGRTLALRGWIRVRTTVLAGNQIQSLTLAWKDRNGGNQCGSAGTCTTTATLLGAATGFDDNFSFFPIETNIDASTGISSFTVTLNLVNGTTLFYDNNGNSYPLTDAIIYQTQQSCLLQGTGALTVSALVRNDRLSLPVTLGVSYLVPRNTKNGNPVPALQSATLNMTAGTCIGYYTFYSTNYTITGGLNYNARLDVISGSGSDVFADSFKKAGELAGTCDAYTGSADCVGGNGASSVTSSTSTTPVSPPPSSTTTTTPGSSSTLTTTTTPGGSSTTSTPSSTTNPSSSNPSSTSTPTSPTTSNPSSTSTITVTPTSPAIKSLVSGYAYQTCWTEGLGVRALSGAAFYSDSMTLELCASHCANSSWPYFGAEYGRECYCGDYLAASSTAASGGNTECNMACAGDATEFCGAANRLGLYLTTASVAPEVTATPAVKSQVGKYNFVGCQTEGLGERALERKSTENANMTLESCAAFCDGYVFFGTEYADECYCGDELSPSSTNASLADCAMPCAGDHTEFCGGSNRLQLYQLNGSTPVVTTQPAVVIAGNWSFFGCMTDDVAGRVLDEIHYAADNMTLEICGQFCLGFKYFGAEYGRECYCGNSIAATSAPVNGSQCDMLCAGNEWEFCGAGNRLSVYSTG